MLEIIVIVWLTRKLSETAKEKGRSKGWGALGAGFWIIGEIMGFVIGGLLGLDLGSYLVAIGMAVLGAFVASTIVKALPAQTPSMGPAV
ncbi:hypothetical protein [Hyalangium gracile]|uniref:hypothetical protein n=1 Tax=Hyalangium gracile TaxID=394092 RepID=UPI001CCEB64F|nr:hypothetical protein [Hyalangium gracile]